MKKFVIMWFCFCALFVCISVTSASERVVVAEEITATWGQYCPGAQMGIHELETRTYDSLVVIAYHASSTNPFYTSESAQRRTYYGNPDYPTMRIDGILSVVGGQHDGNMYPTYRIRFNSRKQIDSPLEISLSLNYNPDSLKGSVDATIRNIGSCSLTCNLHFVLTETDISYSWQGQTMLYHVVRDMLPDANGESISIAMGDSTQKSRNFTVDGTWVEENCNIIVFVQNASKEIYQGAAVAVVPETELTYFGLTPSEVTGNGNGVPEPGEEFEVTIALKNMGTETATGINATVSTTDPYIIVNSPTQSFPDIPIGDVRYSTSPFFFSIDNGCPDPHTVNFELSVSANNFTGSDTFPFMVTTTPGFEDDMESGQGEWTHSGLNDLWHLTEHRSNTPTHSWYSGIEGSWLYENQIDVSLISPYLVVGQSSILVCVFYCRMEPHRDYGLIEIDNGSGWWRELNIYSGLMGWVFNPLDVASYVGQTVRCRFRFVTNLNNVEEGWYVDDVSIGMPVSSMQEEEEKEVSFSPSFKLLQNPIKGNVIEVILKSYNTKTAEIEIYNILGQRVQSYNFNSLNVGENRLRLDVEGVSPGVYFLKLNAGEYTETKKLIKIR